MDEQFGFLTNLPGLLIAKTLDSIYVNITHDFAKLLGWKSAHDCPGRTDFDIPCQAAEFADQFIQMDKQVLLSGEKSLALDVQKYAEGCRLILTERNPIKNEQGIVTGMLNHCVDVSDAAIFKAYARLHQLDSKLLGQVFKPSSYSLSEKHRPLALTKKQENCLFLLVRGKSLKEIAKILKISPRTVETHIEAIKNKLRCQYKSELIEKAIDSGFLYYIPENFQNANFEKIMRAN